jgi:type IV pilus assembly protein PilV
MKHTVKIIRRASFIQRGITLLEALVAMLVLAFGVLGLAVVQGRMLVETRTTNARAEAIRLIADLEERVRLNYPAQSAVNQTSPYVMPPSEAFQPPNTSPNNSCAATGSDANVVSCSPTQQAAYDVWDWRMEIANKLPGGVVDITQADKTRQLKVVIAWLPNENTNTTLSGVAPNPQTAASYQQLSAPLQIAFFNENDANPCIPPTGAQAQQPPAYICHVDFINLPQGN